MSNELQLYSNCFALIDGKLLCQEASVSVEKKSGLNPVFTVAVGLAGMSQGAATCEVTIESAVPSEDFEFNPDAFMRTGQVVELGLIMANRQTVTKGFITDATYQHSVNQESKLTMKLLCRFSDFE
jgi:hypothetical protein